ncbi:MAG: ATP-binding protein [Propionicimonas sp.]|uniref:ATP-binding protein n=1 Tax=Propionicimonas sp. TaxID=1955623 RepID=UPI003D0BA143
MSDAERADAAALRLGILARLADAVGLAESLEQVAQRGVAVLRQNDADHAAVWLLEVLHPGYGDTAATVLADAPVADPGHVHARDAHALAIATVGSGRPEAHPLAGPDLVELYAQPVVEPGQTSPSLVLVVGSTQPLSGDAGFADYLELAAALFGAGYGGLRELAQERQQSESLRELDAAKSAFLANVSHELRTPLALIAAPLDDVLQAGDASAAARDRLTMVRAQVVRLTRMVDAMLDFSRIEAGRIAPNVVELDVPALLRTIVAAFGPAIERAGLRFDVEIPDLPHTALLDQDMLERIVLNLLSNALKYTPRGSVTLTLVPVRDGFEIAVTDTGIGIAVRDQERVFARFEQLPRHSRARSSEGAGIGLAMVKELSELLGGRVDLRSAPSRGSTFTIRLPYRVPEVALALEGVRSVTPRGVAAFLADVESWDPAPSAVAPAPVVAPGERPLLLVVEDSADLSRYLREALSDTYEVSVAADGLQALAMARQRRPDAILSDVMMPGLDGFGLVAEVRADPQLRDLPVVLLSARAGLEASTTGLAQGADDYVVKPFDLADLRARLASNIRRAADRSADASWRRAIIRSLHEAVVISDTDGLVTEFNDAFRRLVGWSMADGPFSPPYPWWPDPETDPDAFERIQQANRELFDDGVMEGEFQLRHRSGRTVWASYNGSVVELPGRGRAAVLKTLRDVTRDHAARVRRQDAARISAEFTTADSLEQLVGIAVDGLHALFDGDSTVQVAGPGVVQTFTASGPIELDGLPAAIAARLAGTDAAEPGEPGGVVQGILLVPPSTLGGTRAWVQFGEPRAVAADEQIVADMLAGAFALAVDRVLTVGELADKQANLERAIESHRLIGQAVGVLVERHRLTPSQAFQSLRRASQDRNIRIRDLAERVLETGLDPDAA